jgi:hypothetical protein
MHGLVQSRRQEQGFHDPIYKRSMGPRKFLMISIKIYFIFCPPSLLLISLLFSSTCPYNRSVTGVSRRLVRINIDPIQNVSQVHGARCSKKSQKKYAVTPGSLSGAYVGMCIMKYAGGTPVPLPVMCNLALSA